MTDKELLEAAAKAAGIALEGKDAQARIWDKPDLLTVLFHNHSRNHPMCRKPSLPGNVEWNPLAEDGDALRLAAKVRVTIEFDADSQGVEVWCNQGTWALPAGNDLLAATRRAIVQAAASISADEGIE